jgi:hypothetical protein
LIRTVEELSGEGGIVLGHVSTTSVTSSLLADSASNDSGKKKSFGEKR